MFHIERWLGNNKWKLMKLESLLYFTVTEQKENRLIVMLHFHLSLRRNGEEWRADRVQLNKEVMMSAAVKRFLPLLDEVAKDFCRMLQSRVEKEGRGEKGKQSITIDPSPDLFRFALEGWRSSPPMICDLCASLAVTFQIGKCMNSCLFTIGPKSWLLLSRISVSIEKGWVFDGNIPSHLTTVKSRFSSCSDRPWSFGGWDGVDSCCLPLLTGFPSVLCIDSQMLAWAAKQLLTSEEL